MSNIAIAGIREAKLQGYKQALEDMNKLIEGKIEHIVWGNEWWIKLSSLKEQISKLEKT